MVDFKIGHHIREGMVSRTVPFFTRKALDDEDFKEEKNDKEGEDEEEDLDNDPAKKVEPSKSVNNSIVNKDDRLEMRY